MGAAESTSRTNGTNQEEKERKQKSSTVVRAAATIAAVGVTAWVLSDNTDTQEDEERKQKSSTVVEAVATIAAVGVVAWGISRMLLFFVKMISRMLLFLVKMISRMLFDNTDTQENVSAMKMKMIDCVPEGKSQTRVITWSPPSPGRLKMNTAGGYRPKEHYVGPEKDSDKLRPSGYGGILRDHNGKWIRGFNGYFGAIDNQTAELHGIHKGLELLDKLGYKGAILETDNTGAYDWVTRRDDDWGKKKSIHDSWNIIIECRELAKKNNITIERIDRKANKCARGLTKSAIKKQVKYEELVDLLKEIEHFYYEEYC